MFLQVKSAGSNIIFAVVTEVSDSVLKGAETSGLDGLVWFHVLIGFNKVRKWL